MIGSSHACISEGQPENAQNNFRHLSKKVGAGVPPNEATELQAYGLNGTGFGVSSDCQRMSNA